MVNKGSQGTPALIIVLVYKTVTANGNWLSKETSTVLMLKQLQPVFKNLHASMTFDCGTVQ